MASLAVVVQLLQRHVPDLAQHATADDLLTDLVQLEAQPVALVGRAFDEALVDQDAEQTVHRALRQMHSSPELRHAEHRVGEGERGQQ